MLGARLGDGRKAPPLVEGTVYPHPPPSTGAVRDAAQRAGVKELKRSKELLLLGLVRINKTASLEEDARVTALEQEVARLKMVVEAKSCRSTDTQMLVQPAACLVPPGPGTRPRPPRGPSVSYPLPIQAMSTEQKAGLAVDIRNLTCENAVTSHTRKPSWRTSKAWRSFCLVTRGAIALLGLYGAWLFLPIFLWWKDLKRTPLDWALFCLLVLVCYPAQAGYRIRPWINTLVATVIAGRAAAWGSSWIDADHVATVVLFNL